MAKAEYWRFTVARDCQKKNASEHHSQYEVQACTAVQVHVQYKLTERADMGRNTESNSSQRKHTLSHPSSRRAEAIPALIVPRVRSPDEGADIALIPSAGLNARV